MPTVSLFVDNETIRLTREGEWLSNGALITHERQVATFYKPIWRDADTGGYEIRVGHDSKDIEVEDTAHFVMSVTLNPQSHTMITLSDGTEEELDPSSLRLKDQRLTCRITRKGHLEEARFKHAPYHSLLALAEERDGKAGILLSSHWWPLGN